MGHYAQRLKKKLARKSAGLPTNAPKRRPGEPLPGGAADIETLINEGHDPIHAAYITIQNLTSHFADVVSQLPEMKKWTTVVARAQDEYMPSGPPMSPLTGSFFSFWALYDLRIGRSHDTMARCQIAANDTFWMNEYQLDACEKLANSRMGIYEHIGHESNYVRLRELITDDEVTCLCPAGYSGRKGELWYVRLAPPLEPGIASFWVAMTTPYILIESDKSDWLEFLRRSMVQFDAASDRDRLFDLMKFGPNIHYWNEFVFKGYHHHQYDAVFLAGLPDVAATLPHA